MKLRLILSILFLGVILGYAARYVKEAVFPGPGEFDSTQQLFDEE